MDRGCLFEKSFTVRCVSNESFVVVVRSTVPGDVGAEFAFTDADDLMAFLIDEKDAFSSRKATAP